jgi:ubiquinone/menaquinone biosynthesis C-methylase UbiE
MLKGFTNNFRSGGDYAHAGEEEAIIKVFSKLNKGSNRLILDVGCGQGGTANFIESNKWGKVVGVDIELASIEYAKKHYSDIEFYQSDVVNLPNLFLETKFDIICLFNSFYAFPDQIQALKSMRKVASDDAQLAIFDYLEVNSSKYTDSKNTETILPISSKKIRDMLAKTGWNSDDFIIEDITVDYQRWYQDLVAKLEKNKAIVIEKYGLNFYEMALKTYTGFVEKDFGGAIVYAKASSLAARPVFGSFYL